MGWPHLHMRGQSDGRTMLKIDKVVRALPLRLAGVAVVISLGACAQAPSRAVQSCESESGQSQFLIDLDAATGRGTLRYQFVGQDAFYRSEDVRADGARPC